MEHLWNDTVIWKQKYMGQKFPVSVCPLSNMHWSTVKSMKKKTHDRKGGAVPPLPQQQCVNLKTGTKLHLHLHLHLRYINGGT